MLFICSVNLRNVFVRVTLCVKKEKLKDIDMFLVERKKGKSLDTSLVTPISHSVVREG